MATSDLPEADALRATGGIVAMLGIYYDPQPSPLLSAFPPPAPVKRGGLVYPVPGKGPLVGEGLERWEREQERKRRTAARERLIVKNFCLCGRRNVGYDDWYEADWRRTRPAGGFCPVHGTTDELDHWDDD